VESSRRATWIVSRLYSHMEAAIVPTLAQRPGSLVAAAVCVALVACGGPTDQNGGGPGGLGDPGTDGATSGVDENGNAGGGGSGDGPITATMESGTYGFDVGRCEIIDDVVYVEALAESRTGMLEASLPPWDRDLAYADRDGGLSLTNFGAGDPHNNFELVAGRGDEGTTWDWTVSGSNVEVAARMANVTTADRSNGVAVYTEYRDVTIEIECGGGVFGSGIDADRFAEQEFHPIEPSLTRAPGSVTIELGGATYEITYLSTCQFFADDVSAEGTANEASVYLYSEGVGVNLDLLVGDRRAAEMGRRWSLPSGVDRQDGFLFEGSDTSRSWSGSIVSEDGTAADATITVECSEGDTHESAGTGFVVLDGVTHELDEITTCTIDGSTVEFFGVSSESNVAIVVTGGGTQILLGDETGAQSSTANVQLEVAGQQVTWSGVLAGNREATLSISC
jgi:hypothetical protein